VRVQGGGSRRGSRVRKLPVFLGLTCLLVLSLFQFLLRRGLLARRSARGTLHSGLIRRCGPSLRRSASDHSRRGALREEEHPLVTTGAYGFVRNPCTWHHPHLVGLAVAFQNQILCSRARRTSCPSCVLHPAKSAYVQRVRAQFEEYARRVGRLLPHLSVPSQIPHNKRMHMSAHGLCTPRSRSGAGASGGAWGPSHRAAGRVCRPRGGS